MVDNKLDDTFVKGTTAQIVEKILRKGSCPMHNIPDYDFSKDPNFHTVVPDVYRYIGESPRSIKINGRQAMIEIRPNDLILTRNLSNVKPATLLSECYSVIDSVNSAEA